MQSWCEGSSSVMFREGAEFEEQMGWDFAPWLAVRALVTESSSLLSSSRLGRDSKWKGSIGCVGAD